MNMQKIITDALKPSIAHAPAWEWPEEARAAISARLASWASECGDAEAMLASIGAYDRRMLVACSMQIARMLLSPDAPSYPLLRAALETCDRWVREQASAGECRKMASKVFASAILNTTVDAVFATLCLIDDDDDLGRVARMVASAMADRDARDRADYLPEHERVYREHAKSLRSVALATLQAFIAGEWMPDEDRATLEIAMIVAVDTSKTPIATKVLAHGPTRELESTVYNLAQSGSIMRNLVVVTVTIDQDKASEPWVLEHELRKQASACVLRSIREDSSLHSQRKRWIEPTSTTMPMEASVELCRMAWYAAQHAGKPNVEHSARQMLENLGCELTDLHPVRKSA